MMVASVNSELTGIQLSEPNNRHVEHIAGDNPADDAEQAPRYQNAERWARPEKFA